VDVAGAPHRRQVGPRDVPARVDLDTLRLEVAELVRDGELRGHLCVAHEPGVDFGDLGLALGERVTGQGEERDKESEPEAHVELLSGRGAPA